LRLITAQTFDQGKGLAIGADQEMLPVINLDVLKTAAWRFNRPGQ
jgi:hypothetical protein